MDKFEWDDANLGHIARHGVSAEEAEEVVNNLPIELGVQDSEGEVRFMEVGETLRGRILVMITTMRGEKVRVVSTFDAPRKWRLYYLARRADPYGPKASHT